MEGLTDSLSMPHLRQPDYEVDQWRRFLLKPENPGHAGVFKVIIVESQISAATSSAGGRLVQPSRSLALMTT